MDLVSAKYGIFGLPFTYQKARLIHLPVPWDVTTSYGKGTSRGPAAIRQASEQVDLFDFETGNVFEQGLHMLPLDNKWSKKNSLLRKKAETVMRALANPKLSAAQRNRTQKLQNEVNKGSEELNAWVFSEAKKILKDGKIPSLVGGDHSSPFGMIRAVLGEFPQTGILHVDAHADLRAAYQGFQHSHASIMWNVVEQLRPAKLVQVGIRDFSEEEFEFGKKKRVRTFFDAENKQRQLSGTPWKHIVDEILAELPEQVYISWDIDGLNPTFCPSTGTPVPGGLSWEEAQFLLSSLVKAKKQIVGFDLNEVAPGATEWDANVGARMLYRLSCLTLLSNQERA